MARRNITDEELELIAQAYFNALGNKSQAARALGIKRQTFNDQLKMAEQRLGYSFGKVADGELKHVQHRVLPNPKKGHRKYILCTSIQNNTRLHPSFDNLVALKDWLNSLDNTDAELCIGTYSYQVNAYGPKAVKRGKHKRDTEELWYAPEAEPYLVDEPVELASGLMWAGEQNILPTNSSPLARLEDYNGRKSNIVPHAKLAMESVASMADEATKFNYTTGTVTQRNYIQKRQGILASQKHHYGASLVCIDDRGNWYVRQLSFGEDGSIMDLGPSEFSGLSVRDGKVTEEDIIESVYWGDIHSSEMELWVRELCWGPGGVVDTHKPSSQFLGDVFSMRSRGHHELKDFHRTFMKHIEGEESVEEEAEITSDLLRDVHREFCETNIVLSNHDRHLDRWLNEADFRADPLNAKFFCFLQYHLLDAMEKGDKDFNVLEFALRMKGLPNDIRFLGLDESYLVLDIENGLHGDLGPNGSRGSTRGLTKLGRKLNKGHDHTAAIRDHVFSAGACSLNFPYMKGPTSHSISFIVTYKNGTRAIVTMWDHKWRI